MNQNMRSQIDKLEKDNTYTQIITVTVKTIIWKILKN